MGSWLGPDSCVTTAKPGEDHGRFCSDVVILSEVKASPLETPVSGTFLHTRTALHTYSRSSPGFLKPPLFSVPFPQEPLRLLPARATFHRSQRGQGRSLVPATAADADVSKAPSARLFSRTQAVGQGLCLTPAGLGPT